MSSYSGTRVHVGGRELLGWLLITGAAMPSLKVAVGARRKELDFIEVSLLGCLLFVPAATLVYCVIVAALVDELVHRRVWFKTVINVANHATPMAAAAAAFLALQPAPPTNDARTWLAATVATAVFSALNAISTSVVIAIATGGRILQSVRSALPHQALNYCLNVGVALSALALWEVPRAGLVVVPVVIIGVGWEYRRVLRSRTERDALALLDTATSPVSALDPLEAFAEVADRAANVLGATDVQVRLLEWAPEGATWCFTRRGDRPDSWAQLSGDPEPDPEAHPIPLVSGSTVLGALLMRVDHELTDQERHVVNAFAATVAAAADRVRGYAATTYAARHDHLTGLANRAGLAEALADGLHTDRPERELPTEAAGGRRAMPEGGGVTALLLLDLDHFKEVNDTLGHESGDRLLREVGRRLGAHVRQYDVVARLGGDEFAVLLRGLHGPEDALAAGQHLLDRLTEPVQLDGLRLPLEGSVGVAVAGEDAADAEGLLRCADIAMYEAKRRRNAVVRYAPEQDTSSPERLALMGELQTGLRRGELRLHYQPKVDLRSGFLTGAEALVRWQHPTRGLLAPGAFIPAVERTGLVLELTLEVLDIAVREAVEWQRGRAVGEPPTVVAVNVSRRCLVHREFPQEVIAVLLRHGLPGRALVLEITESLELAELEVVEDVLTRLRALDIHLSVDDFGTGYSSMSFFQRVAVDEVKIDGSFVQAMHRSSSARAIVRSTLELGHGVGLPVVAEGIETADQLSELVAFGCDSGQGYLLGRPVPGPELRAQLRRRNPAVVAAILAAQPKEPAHSAA